jgi:DNA-binding CsgD family transcriptional regulator
LPEIRQINDWRMPAMVEKSYERMLGAIGTEEFGSTVRDCFQTATAGIRRIYLFEATGRDTSTLQYFSCEPSVVDLLPAYSKRYIQMDPVCDAYAAAPASNDMALLRIRPADISTPGFRRRFFENTGIVERVSIIQRGPSEWRVINVARHRNEGYFSEQELTVLVSLASLALPMLPLNRRRLPQQNQLTVAQLEDRFANRFDALTARECQVCARAAIGMSVEATALDLSIAKTSVLTYRRRAYERLNVSSPYELCSLVTH